MTVEIGTEAAQYPEKEYVSGLFVAVYWTTAKPLQCDYQMLVSIKNHYMCASYINNCRFGRRKNLYKKLFSSNGSLLLSLWYPAFQLHRNPTSRHYRRSLGHPLQGIVKEKGGQMGKRHPHWLHRNHPSRHDRPRLGASSPRYSLRKGRSNG